MAYISQYQPGSFDPNYDAFSYGVADMARSMREGARMEAEATANFGRSIGNAIPEVVGGYLEGQKKKEQEKAANEFVKDITGSMFPDFDAYTESQFYAPAGPNGESGANKPTAEIIDFYASQRGLDPVGKTLLALGHDDGAMKNFVKTFGADQAPALLMDMVDTYASNQPKEWTKIPGTNYFTNGDSVVPGYDKAEGEDPTMVSQLLRERAALDEAFRNGQLSPQDYVRFSSQLGLGGNGRTNSRGGAGGMDGFNALTAGAETAQYNLIAPDGTNLGLINESDIGRFAHLDGYTFTEVNADGGDVTETTETVETEGGDGSGGKPLPNLLADVYKKADDHVKEIQNQAWEDGNGQMYNFGPQAWNAVLQSLKWANDAVAPAEGSPRDLDWDYTNNHGKDFIGDLVGTLADGLRFGSSPAFNPEDYAVDPASFPKEKRGSSDEGIPLFERLRRSREDLDIEETISNLKGEGVLTEEMISRPASDDPSANARPPIDKVNLRKDRGNTVAVEETISSPDGTETVAEETVSLPTEDDFSDVDLAPIDKVNRQFFDFEDAFDSNTTIYLLDTYGRLGQKGKLIKVKPGSKEYKEIAELGTEQAFVDFTELGYQPIPLEIGRELENYRKNEKGKDQPSEGPSILEMYLAPLTAYGMWRKLKNANFPREQPQRLPKRGGGPRLPGSRQGRLPAGPSGGQPRLPGGGGGTPSPTPQSPYLNPPSSLLRGPIGTRPLGGGSGLRRLRMIR